LRAGGPELAGATQDLRAGPFDEAHTPLYDSTKRTHRFLAEFLTKVIMNMVVVTENYERNRWVRSLKRTHRKGFLRHCSLKSGFVFL
jgi:hypothetical protein